MRTCSQSLFIAIFIVGLGLNYPAVAAAAANADCATGSVSVDYILRQDFNDVNMFSCPSASSVARAVGTRVSYTVDELKHIPSASIDGLGAVVFRYYTGGDVFEGAAFGPFVQGSEMVQFAAASTPVSSIDTITAGAFVEAAVTDPLAITHFVRLREGAVTGNQGIQSNSFVGEWLPEYDNGNLHIGTERVFRGLIGYSVTPELMVQYDQLVDGPNKYLLFSTRSDALRVGSQAVVKLFLVGKNFAQPFRWLFDASTLTVSYHRSWDVDTGRPYSFFQPVLTVNLDPKGKFAISASYGSGNSETTGNTFKQVKLSLAAKM